MTISRAPSILAVVGAFVLVASAVLVARVIVAQGAVRTLTGAVTWVDTGQAQFDRDLHAGMGGTSPTSVTGCAAALSDVSLAPGQTVMVYDGSGSVIGRGSLGPARAPVPTGAATRDQDCAVSFVVDGVPRATDYTVEVGPHRATFASYDLDSRGWDIELPVAAPAR
jgi:hypothetical protein